MEILDIDDLRKFREVFDGKEVYTKRSFVKIFDLPGKDRKDRLRKASEVIKDLMVSWECGMNKDFPKNPITLYKDPHTKNETKIIDSDFFEAYYDMALGRYRKRKENSSEESNADDTDETDIPELLGPIALTDDLQETLLISVNTISKLPGYGGDYGQAPSLAYRIHKQNNCSQKIAQKLIDYCDYIQNLKGKIYYLCHPDVFNEYMHKIFPSAPKEKVFDPITDYISDDDIPKLREVVIDGKKYKSRFVPDYDELLNPNDRTNKG